MPITTQAIVTEYGDHKDVSSSLEVDEDGIVSRQQAVSNTAPWLGVNASVPSHWQDNQIVISPSTTRPATKKTWSAGNHYRCTATR